MSTVQSRALYRVTPLLSDGRHVYAVTGPNCRRMFTGPKARTRANLYALELNAKAIEAQQSALRG